MKYLKIIFVFLVLPSLALAATEPGFLDGIKCVTSNDNCQLTDVVEGFQALIRLLLGGMGAVALLYFVIGGFQWVTSRGNSEQVRNGQRTMVNTLFALAIAFTSYLVLNFFVNSILGVKGSYMITGTQSTRSNNPAGECSGKAMNESCNTASLNYVCSGPDLANQCVTKCGLINMIPDNKTLLDQEGWGFSCNDITTHPGAFNFTGKCPGDNNNVCILFSGSSAVSASSIDANSQWSNIIDSLEL